jgi:hypothetical protein
LQKVKKDGTVLCPRYCWKTIAFAYDGVHASSIDVATFAASPCSASAPANASSLASVSLASVTDGASISNKSNSIHQANTCKCNHCNSHSFTNAAPAAPLETVAASAIANKNSFAAKGYPSNEASSSTDPMSDTKS